ncbi:MAG: type II toxin-antitoxin system YoeB family toxin [Firmicutes bacterium]|nr:type II toxin-antitoxin system YoeB family toxin [Bacillota bacterium]
MNKRIVFQGRGWDDYVYWQAEDRRTLKKINSLIQDNNIEIVQCRSHYDDK